MFDFKAFIGFYVKRVQTFFSKDRKTKREEILSNSFGDRGTIIFQFVEVTGKQGVVAVTQRSFHPEKQTLKISQGIVGESKYALRILCLQKI